MLLKCVFLEACYVSELCRGGLLVWSRRHSSYTLEPQVFWQGPEFNGYLTGRGNSRDVDLNRDFPDLNALMYYHEKNNGRNHHFPLPDNWEEQVMDARCRQKPQRQGAAADTGGRWTGNGSA